MKFLMENLVKQKFLIEEFLNGEEMSFFTIHGQNVKQFYQN